MKANVGEGTPGGVNCVQGCWERAHGHCLAVLRREEIEDVN